MVFIDLIALPARAMLLLPQDLTFVEPAMLFVKWQEAPVSQIQMSEQCKISNDASVAIVENSPLKVPSINSMSHSVTSALTVEDSLFFFVAFSFTYFGALSGFFCQQFFSR